MAGTFTFNPVSGTNLGSDIVQTVLNKTINVTFTPTDAETLSHVTISADITDSNAILTGGASSATITGYYSMDLFPNLEIKYLPPNRSDKVDEVTIVNSTTSVPAGQEVFSVVPDSRATRTVTYTVTAYGTLGSSEVATYTYTPQQDHSPVRDWLIMYFEDYYRN